LAVVQREVEARKVTESFVRERKMATRPVNLMTVEAFATDVGIWLRS